MKSHDRIYVAGHQGLLGSALVRSLEEQGYTNLITADYISLDLRNQSAVNNFFSAQKPQYVFLAAAKVGGIKANNARPAEFIYDNLMIQTNIIHAAYKNNVQKLLFLGSSCIYPRICSQPIQEDALLTGPLEPTNKAYAIAKIAGITLCQSYSRQYATNFITCMPTNLYGPHDTFDAEKSHVIPALITKIHTAHMMQQKTVTLWGTGRFRREFMYVDDCAQSLIFLMNEYHDTSSPINVGTGIDITISELAVIIKEIIGYQGVLVFDPAEPEGTPQKLLNVERLKNLGWKAKISLADGLKKTYHWYKKHMLSMPKNNPSVLELS